jgi:hypothetical protein
MRLTGPMRAVALVILIGGTALMLVTMADMLFGLTGYCVSDYDLTMCYSSSLPAWVALGWLPALILGGLLYSVAGSKREP